MPKWALLRVSLAIKLESRISCGEPFCRLRNLHECWIPTDSRFVRWLRPVSISIQVQNWYRVLILLLNLYRLLHFILWSVNAFLRILVILDSISEIPRFDLKVGFLLFFSLLSNHHGGFLIQLFVFGCPLRHLYTTEWSNVQIPSWSTKDRFRFHLDWVLLMVNIAGISVEVLYQRLANQIILSDEITHLME